MSYNFRFSLSRPDKLVTEENETSKDFNNFIVDMGDKISTIQAYQVHNPSKKLRGVASSFLLGPGRITMQ